MAARVPFGRRRVLVLGGGGFIGQHTVRALQAAGHEVTVLSRSAHRPDSVVPKRLWHQGGMADLPRRSAWLDGIQTVVHLAWSTIPATAARAPNTDLQANVGGTLAVLEAMRRSATAKHLVFLSSGGALYGAAPGGQPVSETAPTQPLGAYGIAKLAAEYYCQTLGRDHDLTTTILRPSNPYGLGQTRFGVLGVVTSFVQAARTGQTATLIGPAGTVRDFIDVRDLADLIARAVTTPRPGIYNAGSGQGRSLRAVITAVEQATGRRLQLHRRPARAFDPPRVVLDIAEAQATFDWPNPRPLEQGLHDLVRDLDRVAILAAS